MITNVKLSSHERLNQNQAINIDHQNQKWIGACSNLGMPKQDVIPSHPLIPRLGLCPFFGSYHDATNICNYHMSKASNATYKKGAPHWNNGTYNIKKINVKAALLNTPLTALCK